MIYEGAALQQGRGWEQKGGEVGNWKMMALRPIIIAI